MFEKNFYEKAWKNEETIRIKNLNFKEKLRQKLTLDRHQLVSGWLSDYRGKLLDIGCGPGTLLFSHPDNFDQLVGIDIVTSQLDIVREKAAQAGFGLKTKLISHNLHDTWPFEKDYFDVAVCVAVLEHLFDPYDAMQQINHALKKGGVIIIDVPNVAYLKHRLQILIGKLPNTSADPLGWDGGHLHYFTQKTLIQLVESNGFKVLEVSGCGLLGKLRNRWPSLLTGDICLKAVKIK